MPYKCRDSITIIGELEVISELALSNTAGFTLAHIRKMHYNVFYMLDVRPGCQFCLAIAMCRFCWLDVKHNWQLNSNPTNYFIHELSRPLGWIQWRRRKQSCETVIQTRADSDFLVILKPIMNFDKYSSICYAQVWKTISPELKASKPRS